MNHHSFSESQSRGGTLLWGAAYSEEPSMLVERECLSYPILSHLARKYLAISATSVPSERAFSSAGNIVSVKRSCLQPESVNMLVFLAENLQ